MGKKDEKILVQHGKRVERKHNEFPQELIVAGRNNGRMFDEFAQYNYKPRLGDLEGFNRLKQQHVEKLIRELHERRALGLEGDRAMDMMNEISRLSQGHYELGYRQSGVDPNSAEGIEELMMKAASQGLEYPFMLCMTQRTWSEFLNPDAKEFIVEQMDEGALEVKIDPQAPDKAIYLREKN